MRLEPVSTSRRSILKFAGAMPAFLALGGMAACTPQANHGLISRMLQMLKAKSFGKLWSWQRELTPISNSFHQP